MPLDLKPLTALRFAAALWVVSFLYWPHLAGVPMPAFVSRGNLGVEMFFVLSGFILSHVYLQPFGEGRFHYGKFLWARVARVYPLHLAVIIGLGLLVAAASVAGMALSGQMVSFAALPSNLTLTHAWGLSPSAAWNHPSWSISAEWFAYLSFPLFAFVYWRGRARPMLTLAITLALMFGLYALFQALAGFPLTEATFRWGALRIVPCFAYGCSLYLLWRSNVIRSATAALLGAAGCAVAILVLGQTGAPGPVMVAAFGGLILSLGSLTSTGSTVLSGKFGVWLGEISYAVYMVCFPWLLIYTKAAEKLVGSDVLPPLLWAPLLVGVVPVAALAHHLVERPARNLMRRWADRGFPVGARGLTRPA